jgi:hypothetical protein
VEPKFLFPSHQKSKNMSRMDEDSEEENSSPLDSVLGEIKQLERHIALADYELRKLPSSCPYWGYITIRALIKFSQGASKAI